MKYQILEYIDDAPITDTETVLQEFTSKAEVRKSIKKIADLSPHRYDWRYHITVSKIHPTKKDGSYDAMAVIPETVMIYHKGKITEFSNEQEVMGWFKERIKCGDFSEV